MRLASRVILEISAERMSLIKEETEVKKNKEWAFIELGKLFPSHAEMYDYPDNITVMKCELLNKVYDILSQLDEPEVLSQEWIERNTSPVDDEGRLYIWKRDLQNLLVPKLELPVIPKFVANELEDKKAGGQKLYSFMSTVLNRINHITDWKEWSEKNANWADIIARAWLDGYTVEEKKYYVLDSEDIPLLEKANNQTCKTTTGLSIYEDGRDNSRFELTEQEIKDYDIRYWAFVEEVDS